MSTLFIADLHLSESHPLIANIFLNFLYEQASHADALFILGDLFDVWIGDDYKTDFHEMIIQALQETSQRSPIYWMPGNRDFLIGKNFLKQSGCQLLKKDPCVVPIYGTPVLLSHGDLLCHQDKSYQFYRRLSRSWLVRQWFLAKPLKKRLVLAQYLRNLSQSKMNALGLQQKLLSTLDVSSSILAKWATHYKVNYIIHGHTHLPAIHTTPIKGIPMTRIVLGPWHHYGFVLSCEWDAVNKKLDFKQSSIL